MKSNLIFKCLTVASLTKRYQPGGTVSGFTVIELLMMLLMVGILTAIAAPSWDAFTTGQRLSSVNDRVFQAIKLAQAEAKRTKQEVTLSFTQGTTTQPPQYQLSTETKPVSLNLEGQIKLGTIQIYAATKDVPPKSEIKFDYLGTTQQSGFTVVTYLNSNKNARHCSIVETMLGTTRVAKKTDCATPP